VVASVSCIYNLGSPQTYLSERLILKKGQSIGEEQLLNRLLDLQYERNDYELWRGRFRKRANFIDVWPASENKIFRVGIQNGIISSLAQSVAPFGVFEALESIDLWPSKFWLSENKCSQ